MIEVQVDLEDVQWAALMVTGMIRRADDGVFELTDKGAAWLNDWCDRKLEEHQPKGSDA